jgi:hypothetical protein
MDPYRTAAYPNTGFRNEPTAQRVMTLRRKAKERQSRGLLIAWVAVFFASLLFGVLGWPSVTLAGIALLFLLFLPLAFLLLYVPAPDCPQCGRRMKKDWALLENGRSGEFVICSACHIYLFTHRTLR